MNSNSGNTVNIGSLFASAAAMGNISPEAAKVLAIPDLGAQMQAGLGIGATDVQVSEAVLVGVMPDDSYSIKRDGNEENVRNGVNIVRDAIMGSKQGKGTLMLIRYLNGHVLYPFGDIARAPTLDASNFDANGGTPLYDQTVVLLGNVLAQKALLADAGMPSRSITLIVTDGHDEASRSCRSPRDVAAVVKSLAGETDIVAAMGISDGTTDFRNIFREMGIVDKWILTPGSNPSDIRKAFQLFSQSAARFSQVAPAQAAAAVGGGFGV